jgi:Na+-driven multidrug efflux pump
VKPSRLLEVKALIVIALPLIFAYLADVLMIVTAKMVVGRLGATELAAVGISTDLSYQMCIILMGLFSVVGVLVVP